MRVIRAVCRILFSLVFVCAGILKLIDPVGTGLIVKEYLTIIHISSSDLPAICMGTGLAALEFTTGICILIGLKMRIFASIGLVLTLFFTAITLYLAIYNPISDCGCFGQAIHLTNWQTFQKNVVLLILITIIFIGRKNATTIAPEPFQWAAVCIFASFAILTAVCSYIKLPQIDFTKYTVGTDLSDDGTATVPEYETVFTYEKEGCRSEFTLENLPDSTWTFIDSRTTLKNGTGEDFTRDLELLKDEGAFFIVSIYDPSSLKPRQKKKIDSFLERAEKEGLDAFVLSTDGNADRKTLLTLNRSNGGVTYFNDGVIVGKWAIAGIDRLDPAEITDEDPDVMVLQKRIHEQLFLSILVLSIFAIAAILRMLCRMICKNF